MLLDYPLVLISGCRNIPSSLEFLPFMSFKQKARVWKKKMEEFVDAPWEWCLWNMVRISCLSLSMLKLKRCQKQTSYKSSFCSTLLEDVSAQEGDKDIKDNFEFDLKWTANSMYGASIDTVRFVQVLVSTPRSDYLWTALDTHNSGELCPRYDFQPGCPSACTGGVGRCFD